MNIVAAFPIEEWRPDAVASLEADLDALGEVLHAVVHTGAGVSFVVPFAVEEARAFWLEKVLPGVRAGTRRVLVARHDGRIVGTVQIDCATPPNQTHRAEARIDNLLAFSRTNRSTSSRRSRSSGGRPARWRR